MYGNHQSMFLQLMALNLLLINRMFASSCFAMSIVLDYIAYDRQNFHLYHQHRYHIFPLGNHHKHFLHFFDHDSFYRISHWICFRSRAESSSPRPTSNPARSATTAPCLSSSHCCLSYLYSPSLQLACATLRSESAVGTSSASAYP